MLENRKLHHNNLRGRPKLRKTFIPFTGKYRRSRREIDRPTVCANTTFTIKYEDEYRVSNNFLITYQGLIFSYFQYRVTDNGLQVCISADPVIQEEWRYLVETEKENLAFKHCNASVDGFFSNNYTLLRNFTVFFKPTQQSFTRQDYGVILGHFAICSGKLSLSCNDYLVNVKYGGQYKVFKDFSLSYRKKHYDYREYRFKHDTFA